jgi:hypothetical protein
MMNKKISCFILIGCVAVCCAAFGKNSRCEFSAKESGAPWSTRKLNIPKSKWHLNYKKNNMVIVEDSLKGRVIKLICLKPQYQEVSLKDVEFIKKCADGGRIIMDMEFKVVKSQKGKMFFRLHCIVSSNSKPGKSITVDIKFYPDKIVSNRKKTANTEPLNQWSNFELEINTENNSWILKKENKKILEESVKPRKSKYSNYVWFGHCRENCSGIVLVNKVIVKAE